MKNHTTFTVEYDFTEQADVLAGALTGDDNDALLAAEQAFNAQAKRLTGTDPEVRFDLSDALRDLVQQHRRLADTQAIDAIHRLLDATEWEASTLEHIAEILARTGRTIEEPTHD